MQIEGINLLLHLGLILLSATFFNYIAKLLKQPPLLGYILAGIFIGPLGLGSSGIMFGSIPLGVTTTDEILILSELGVAFLLFSVGIESDISKMRYLGKVAVLGTIAQVGLTTVLVALFNHVLGILSFEQALYLGLIISFSSTTIVVKLLSDARAINSLEARLMIGFLLMQDFLVILAMPLLANFDKLASAEIILNIFGQVALLLAVAFALNRHVYPRLFAFAAKSEELFFLSAMSSVFIFIFLSYMLGISIAVGAFIAGVTISTLPYNLEVLNRIRGVRDFLGTIFFVTLGIQITLKFVSFPLELGLFVVLIVFLLKPIVFFITTISSGFGGRTSIAVALGLTQVSEFSFIIANQGKPILEQTPGLYSFVVLIISISMALTPYLMGSSEAIHRFVESRVDFFVRQLRKVTYFYRKINAMTNVTEKHSKHIVVFGAGTIGSGIISAFIGKNDLVAIDSDSDIVAKMIRQGVNTIYGTIDNRDIWHKAHVEKANVIVLALPFHKSSLELIRHIRFANPRAVIFARCHYFGDALALYDVGVDFVIMPQVAGTNLFIKKISEYLEHGKVHEISNYQGAFMDYLKEKSREERMGLIDTQEPRYV